MTGWWSTSVGSRFASPMARDTRGWHQSVMGVAKRTLEAAYEDNIPFLASALSFDVILTAIPFLVLLLGVVGSLVQHQIATQQLDLAELLRRFMPGGDAVRDVETVLAQVVASRGQLTLFGVPLFLYFSTRLFGGLRAALNDVFDTEERRPWLWAATANGRSRAVSRLRPARYWCRIRLTTTLSLTAACCCRPSLWTTVPSVRFSPTSKHTCIGTWTFRRSSNALLRTTCC